MSLRDSESPVGDRDDAVSPLELATELFVAARDRLRRHVREWPGLYVEQSVRVYEDDT